MEGEGEVEEEEGFISSSSCRCGAEQRVARSTSSIRRLTPRGKE